MMIINHEDYNPIKFILSNLRNVDHVYWDIDNMELNNTFVQMRRLIWGFK